MSPCDRRQCGGASRRDGGDRTCRAVEVVHQVEGVDEPHDPDDREQQVDRLDLRHVPGQARSPERGRGRDRGQHALQRAEADPVVERPDGKQAEGAQDDHRVLRCAAAQEHGGRQEGRHHGGAAEIGRGPAVLLEAHRPVEEVWFARRAESPPERPSAPRRGRGRRRARAAPHPASRTSSSESGRELRSSAITSSIASSTVCFGSQPVKSRSAVVSGRRRPSSSNPSSYASS